MNIIVEEAKKAIENAENFISDNGYYNNNYDKRLIAFNVKHYWNFPIADKDNLDKLIDGLNNFEDYEKDFLKNNLNEEWLYNETNYYLKGEINYFINEFLKGKCTISSKEWWLKKIESAKTPELIKKLQQQFKEDMKIDNYLNIINSCDKYIGLFGRGGGHFSVYLVEDIKNEIEGLNNLIDESSDRLDDQDIDEISYYTKELNIVIEALEWIKNEIETGLKGVLEGQKDEIEYRIVEFFETEKESIENRYNSLFNR